MNKLIIVEDGIDVVGPCGYGMCTVYFKVCEFCDELDYDFYRKVDCIEYISCENSDEEVPFTISGEIGEIEYEGVSMLEGATHYIVSCQLERNKKMKEMEEK